MDVKGKVPRRWEDIAAKKKSGTSLNLVQGVSRHLHGKRLADLFTNASDVNYGHVLLSDLHILYAELCQICIFESISDCFCASMQ